VNTKPKQPLLNIKEQRMKRVLMVITALAVLVPASLWAQETPKAEVFGGFSVLRISEDGDSTTPVGWQAAVSANLNERFAIVGDFGGAYKNDATECPSCKIYSYLGGVRVNHRLEKATVFAHALYGGTRFSFSGASDNAFTMGYGGGVDINTSPKMAVRIIQFDWLPSKSEGEWTKNIIRLGFGVVFKSGSK